MNEVTAGEHDLMSFISPSSLRSSLLADLSRRFAEAQLSGGGAASATFS